MFKSSFTAQSGATSLASGRLIHGAFDQSHQHVSYQPCCRFLHSASPIRMQASATGAVEAAQPSTQPLFAQEEWSAPQPSRLIKDKRIFQEEHRIRGYEAGPDQRTSMGTMANLLQEVASNHAVAMWGRAAEGFAADPALAEEGLIFVMTRMQIQMDEYPRWGDIVEIETWFHAQGKIGAQRDWTIVNKTTGQHIGRATSTWVMINMRTRRLTKMPEYTRGLLESYQYFGDAISPEYTRQRLPELDTEQPEVTGPLQVARRSDMDMNGHINNVVYLEWALETTPKEVHDSCHLYQMEIDFKAECHSGEVVETMASCCPTPETLASNGAGPDALTYVHLLRRCEGDSCTELVKARTTWRAGEKA